MPPGFLAVSSHPSSLLPLTEFNEWYEEEHVPLRLNDLREFISGARYTAIDLPSPPSSSSDPADRNEKNVAGSKPTWLALYQITSTSTFASPSYTSLRTNRSAREASVMVRIEVLVRITAEVAGVWRPQGEDGGDEGGEGEGGLAGGRKGTGFKPGNPSPFVVTHQLLSTPSSSLADLESLKSALGLISSKPQGWLRTHIVKVVDTGVARFGKPSEDGENDGEAIRGDYFSVHEFTSEDSARTWSTFFSDPSLIHKNGVEIKDIRIWKLYKAYPSLYQGNLEG